MKVFKILIFNKNNNCLAVFFNFIDIFRFLFNFLSESTRKLGKRRLTIFGRKNFENLF
jgi:hypothetical protein